MVTANRMNIEDENALSNVQDKGRDRSLDKVNDKSYDRTVGTSPQPYSWKIIAAGAVVPLGLAGAALITTQISQNERVAIAAWVAVAVVGSASVVSAAAVSHQRLVAVDRIDRGTKSTEKEHSHSRAV